MNLEATDLHKIETQTSLNFIVLILGLAPQVAQLLTLNVRRRATLNLQPKSPENM